ncbi:MAG TPA: methionine gamma-lyase family protein [Candidatus Eremiobacteraceae bacterium]|nr:methionine gamma-lyase family protein [Candidatus Eremiobacteraceae bacterium]
MIERLRAAAARFDFTPRVVEAAEAALAIALPAWAARDAHAFEISAKVTRAFADADLHEGHLAGTTGYGYHDRGREAYEALFARLMDTDAALARLQLTSGTQAIVATLAALLEPGARLCSVTGRPYDTLRLALVDHPRSLAARGVHYDEVPWTEGSAPAASDIAAALDRVPDVVFVQRSRGYAPRPSLDIAAIGDIVRAVRERAPSAAVVVDNCYGEFVESSEPCAAGADAVVGSLIKNPGGGMAVSGAYIAGRAELVEKVAERFFSPGLGAAIGPTLGTSKWFFAGLNRAPRCVAESLKTMDFAAALFGKLGYPTDPACGAARTDIIQAIRLGSPEKLKAFATGLQRMLPVNSRATPEPGAVPGYVDPVVMADGAFVAGSTLELSCDAPMRAPFEVYLQGGLDAAHGVLAAMNAASAVERAGRGTS